MYLSPSTTIISCFWPWTCHWPRDRHNSSFWVTSHHVFLRHQLLSHQASFSVSSPSSTLGVGDCLQWFGHCSGVAVVEGGRRREKRNWQSKPCLRKCGSEGRKDMRWQIKGFVCLFLLYFVLLGVTRVWCSGYMCYTVRCLKLWH